MEQVSTTLKVAFIAITLLTVWQFYVASQKSKLFLIIISLWMTAQMALGLTNFYENESTIPSRFVLLIVPAIVLIVIIFATKTGKIFVNNLSIKELTLLHTIRIPVEIVLYYLFAAKAIPQVMTFDGRNFDIVAGMTAPIVFYWGFVKNKLSNTVLIIWNLVCLGLLANIVIIALLSAKTPFQQFAFEQPNIAVGYFPFNWLPSVVVPIVLFAHLATLKQLVKVDQR